MKNKIRELLKTVEGSKAVISMTLTSLGCPAAPLIETRVKEAARQVDGIEDVEVEWTFDLPWSPGLLTDAGREILESMGYL